MDEAKWRAAKNPLHPLMYARRALRATRTNAGKRKLRLFGCACARRVWDSLPDPDRELIAAAERFADREIRADELWRAAQGPGGRWNPLGFVFRRNRTRASRELMPLAVPSAWPAASVWRAVADGRLGARPTPDAAAEKLVQTGLVRCLFGNPFRPVAFEKKWRSTVAVSLADAIYREHAFDRLPVLADALEEAGCDDPDVLAHCREPGPHARGCWVVDGALGK